MSLPAKLIDTAQADIEQLVTEQAVEGPHLDFKRDYPSTWDNATKHEFLADVSAFANAGGGDLVYGVDENGNAQASAVVPQVLTSADVEVRRMQDLLLNMAEPRIPGVQVQAVPVTVGTAAGYVLVVRVPQSWAGPHRVKSNQHFFIRDGARKRQLDVPEVRGLFLRSENQAQRVRDFRTERIGKLLSDEAPHKLVEGPLVVVHVVPTQAALGLIQIDPVPYATARYLPVLGASSGLSRLNVDGALMVRNPNPQGTHGYSQFFRNGFFESVYVLTRRNADGRASLPSLAYEEHAIALLRQFRIELVHLGIDTEVTVMLSLLRADETQLGVDSRYDFLDDHQTFFDRKTIVLPDVLARSDLTPELALKPVFDLVWQAAGFERSRNYSAAGLWAPAR